MPAIERIALADLKSDPRDLPAAAGRAEQELDAEDRGAVRAPGHARSVVVGAAHLVGPDGLLAMLKAKGYTIEQL